MEQDEDGNWRIALIFGGLVLLGAVVIAAVLWLMPRFAGTSEVAATTGPQARVEEPASALAGPLKPTFDIVRVERDGRAIAAGRAAPGAIVTLSANGTPIGTATADARGEWTLVLDEPLTEGTQELTLSARLPGGEEIASDQRVIVVVVARADGPPLVVKRQEGEASEVLQGGARGAGPGLAISAIDYDGRGNVIFSGLASPGAGVRAYVDGAPVGSTTATAKGRWIIEADSRLPAGVYSMRLDQIGADGRVTARIEFPFEREDPRDIVLGDGTVVVQPGNSLWKISSRVYGQGIDYTIIYDANRTQIRNPDLIYPGQIFELPPNPRDIDRPAPAGGAEPDPGRPGS